jgi:DNA polymerase-4
MIACFFLPEVAIACERARLPRLRDFPVIITEDQETVAVASSEATAWAGVTRGMALSAARALVGPDLVVLPYDRDAYLETVHCLWDLLAIESDIVEPVSPEVCFLDLSGRDVLERAGRLGEQVAERVQTPVQIGIARSKFVARQAAQHAEHNRPLLVAPGAEAPLLALVPLTAVPGIERAHVARLRRLGLQTLGDVAAVRKARLPRDIGWRLGHLLRAYADGWDSDPVRALWPPHVITKSQTFDDEIGDAFLVENALLRLVEQVARQLAQERAFCRRVTLQVGLADRSFLVVERRLAQPQSQTPALFRALSALFGALQQEGKISLGVVSLTVTAGDVGTGSGVQMELMDAAGEPDPTDRRRRLDAALAYLRRRFGGAAVVRGSLLMRGRPAGLWTYPFTHRLAEPIQVTSGPDGMPICYRRSSSRAGGGEEAMERVVTRICDHWVECTLWPCIPASRKRAVYRVETLPFAVVELTRMNGEWRLTGVTD